MSTAPNPAATYEAFMVPFLFRPWANQLIDRASMRSGDRMLDIACGTGIVARIAAERNSNALEIFGLDMNPEMIESAQVAAAQEATSITWIVASADDLPFEDNSFDLITIEQGLQFFPDKPATLAESFRVLRPGGRLLLALWAPLEQQGFYRYFVEGIVRETGSPAMHTPYCLSDLGEIQSLLSDSNFDAISSELVEIELTYAPIENFLEQLVESVSVGVPAMRGRTPEERALLCRAIVSNIQDDLARYTFDGRLMTPSRAFIVRAYKPD